MCATFVIDSFLINEVNAFKAYYRPVFFICIIYPYYIFEVNPNMYSAVCIRSPWNIYSIKVYGKMSVKSWQVNDPSINFCFWLINESGLVRQFRHKSLGKGASPICFSTTHWCQQRTCEALYSTIAVHISIKKYLGDRAVVRLLLTHNFCTYQLILSKPSATFVRWYSSFSNLMLHS